MEEWSTSMVAAGLSHATLRNYQQTVALFVAYLCDLRYDWTDVCVERFGTHPTQVFHEGNMAVHRSETEGRPTNRPFSGRRPWRSSPSATRAWPPLRIRAARAGWPPNRDSVLFKVIYAWGLRRREAAMLDVSDWITNPAEPQYGRFGAVAVRYGKASKGTPPKRGTVHTSMAWAAEVVAQSSMRSARSTRRRTAPCCGPRSGASGSRRHTWASGSSPSATPWD